MSYQVTVSGHAASQKAEAQVLAAAIAFAKATSSEGGFTFAGTHFHVQAGPTEQATESAQAALDEYNASADADDQAG